MQRFEVGDLVSIIGKFGDEKDVAEVVVVLKSRIVLSNGERYTHNGDKLHSDGTVSRKIGQTIRKVS